jgi:hypothetical protein
MRRSWKRRLDRAALSRSSSVRLSALSWRTRCLSVVFLRGDPLDVILCPFSLQIADAAEEFAEAVALGKDLGVGGLKRILSVEGPLPPGQFL